MRIVLFADNYIGMKVVEKLKKYNEDIVGLFIHPPQYQNYTKEIIKLSQLPKEYINVVGKEWKEGNVSKLYLMKPDIILVIFWNYILPKEVFRIPKKGCINFHLSYLPYNRGKKPNVWPLIDGSPAGITMHYIDEGIDSGNIISQKKIEVELTDTAQTLYEKLINEFPKLFEETWPKIKNDRIQMIPNKIEEGSFHLDREFNSLDEINLDRKYDPIELINQLRARTFPPNPSCYFFKDGKKVNVKIQLEYGD